jgi:hypothetical protein
MRDLAPKPPMIDQDQSPRGHFRANVLIAKGNASSFARCKRAMISNLDARFSRCDHIGAAVCIDQTEGQCRDLHHCSVELCPLQDKFANDRLAMDVSAVVGGWVGLLPYALQRHK